jgi:hypothetical protein
LLAESAGEPALQQFQLGNVLRQAVIHVDVGEILGGEAAEERLVGHPIGPLHGGHLAHVAVDLLDLRDLWGAVAENHVHAEGHHPLFGLQVPQVLRHARVQVVPHHRMALAIQFLHRIEKRERGRPEPLHLLVLLFREHERARGHQPGHLPDWTIAKFHPLGYEGAGALLRDAYFFPACRIGNMVDPGKPRRSIGGRGGVLEPILHFHTVLVLLQ